MNINALTIIGLVLLVVGCVIVGPFITAWAWNTLFAESVTMSLFGVAKIGWWKALAMGIFASLFKTNFTTSNSKNG